MTVPRTRKLSLLLSILMGVLAFAALSIKKDYPLHWGDEGFFANGALRVLSGEVIYRDFQHNYSPGRVFSLALLVSIFGQSLAVVRFFWCFLHAAAVAVSVLVARRLMPLSLAVLVGLTVLFNTVYANKSVELLLPGLALLVTFRLLEKRGSDLEAGLVLAVVALFRQDVGFFALVLYALTLFFQAGEAGEGRYLARLGARVRSAWPFALGYVLVVLPFAIYLLANGALLAALRDVTVSGFVANRALELPFPALVEEWSWHGVWSGLLSKRAAFYLPPIAYAITLCMAGLRLRRREQGKGARELLLATLIGLMLFVQVLPRSDEGHLQKAYLPAHVLGMFLVAAAGAALVGHLRARRKGRAALGLLVLLLALAVPGLQLRLNFMGNLSIPDVILNGHTYEAIELPHGRQYMKRSKVATFERFLIEFPPRDESSPPEYLIVYPAGALWNFLLGLPSPLRYDTLRPGELGNNDPEILDAIMQRVREVKPRYLIQTFEQSNPRIVKRFHAYATKAGYRFVDTHLLRLYVRS